MNPEKIKETITREIKSNVDTAVIGLSGGADSLLVSLLSMEALGKGNVYTLSMPYSDTDKTTFNSLSQMYAEHIGVNHRVVSVKTISDAIVEATLSATGTSDNDISVLNKGNARSRARMNVLYGCAHHLNETLKCRVRVMGTGNLSEDFIGYDTKGGDALADLFPIGELLKPEVYQMLEYFRDIGIITEEMINRVPSAGLWEDQTDEDELGYSYDEMAPVIRKLLKDYDSIDMSGLTDLECFVWKRHLANKHKHEAPPVIKLRDEKGALFY